MTVFMKDIPNAGKARAGAQRAAKAQKRLSRADWIEAAANVLASGGVDRVRVESLAVTLKVSKGSFYWHFKDRNDLLQSVIEDWQVKSTFAVQERLAETESAPLNRLYMFMELPLHSRAALKAADLEMAIQSWARQSKEAADAVSIVDQARLNNLTELFCEAGLPRDEALFRAHQAYAFLRYVAYRRDMDAEAKKQLVSDFHRRLTHDIA